MITRTATSRRSECTAAGYHRPGGRAGDAVASRRSYSRSAMNLIVRAVLAWLPMVVIAVANGVLREAVLTPRLSELRAHQLSSLTLVLLFALYVWGVRPFLRLRSREQALGVGALWLFLTVLFEFGFGHWIAGHPWEKLLADYDLVAGRLWALVLLWVGLAPLAVYEVGSRRND